jgi:hypothetical protein
MALRHMGKMPMLRQSDFSNTLLDALSDSGVTAVHRQVRVPACVSESRVKGVPTRGSRI